MNDPQPNSEVSHKTVDQFFLVGISYKKTDAEIRSLFAINQDQNGQLLALGSGRGMGELFVLSTCNRTEIYGFVSDPARLIDLLCQFTKGDTATFRANAFICQGWEAVQHLCEVSAGLDSQILGDYEINGQIKQAARIAKEHGCLGAFTERLINTTLQLSKNIKNNTGLSSGTVSVAFAAIQYLKTHLKTTGAPSKIVLVGVGKIGRNTCKNALAHLSTREVVVVNRTEEAARGFAAEQGIRCAPMENLQPELADADAVIVATNAERPTLPAAFVAGSTVKLVLDLSIPFNADTEISKLPGVTLINVDDLSRETDATLQRREAEVPKARAIVREFLGEFREWYQMRQHLGVLKNFRQTLSSFPSDHLDEADCTPEEHIQKVMNTLAVRIRGNNPKGCSYLQAVHDYLNVGS